MKRWLTHLTIAAYLSALSWGLVSHAVQFGATAHPAMYFVVWDMFCGWAAYSTRNHAIIESESGKFYEVFPPPWGELEPYGDLGRRHYDPYQSFCLSMTQNVLRNTDHEPVARIFVLEEAWAKKYNLPDALWDARYEEPKTPHHYWHTRHVFSSDGVPLQINSNWLGYQIGLSMANNPRLQADARKNKPFVTLGSHEMWQNQLFQNTTLWNQNPQAVGSPLGN